MSLYLKEAPTDEAMTVFYGEHPPPLTHTVWTGDFMCACTHDIACPVCFDSPAMIERNVTYGTQTVQPCSKCQAEGYRIRKLPKWLRWTLGETK